MTRFEEIASRIGKTVAEKNEAYGDSAATSAEAFKLLFPDGIPVEKYGDALLLVRVWDKMKRIATHKTALGENPWEDIAGYGILGSGQPNPEIEHQVSAQYVPSLAFPSTPLSVGKVWGEGMAQDSTALKAPAFRSYEYTSKSPCTAGCAVCAAIETPDLGDYR